MPLYFANQRLGGAMVFGQQIGAANTSVNPGSAALTVTGYAPAISQGSSLSLAPGAAALALSGFAPNVAQSGNQALSPSAVGIVVSGLAPTVSQSSGLNLQPAAAALNIFGYAPTVAQAGSIQLSPGAASLIVQGYAPTVQRSGGTLRQQLYSALNPLAAGGAWFQVNTAEPPVFPFIVFTRVVSPQNVNMQGASDIQNTRVQVDLFVRDDSQLEALEDAIDAAIVTAFPLTSVPISTQDLYEDPVKAYRSLREYSIWGAF